MPIEEIFERIRTALNGSPRNAYVAELHVQVIKYAESFGDLTGREFCAALGIGASFGAEFTKMRKIAARLEAAGLDVDRL